MSQSTTARAGKKHAYVAPPAPNAEKAAAREAGRRQFTAKVFPALRPDVDPKMARLYDTGFRFDTSRKQIISPPARKEPASSAKLTTMPQNTKGAA